MRLEIVSVGKQPFDRRSEIAAMLSDDEKALYRQVARGYTGMGAVVEIGSWLGAGTYQICSGLVESGHDANLTVFDRFVWSPIYAASYPSIQVGPNNSFLGEFRKNLAPYRDMINVVVGEVSEIEKALPLAGAVELLFIDAPKSWRLLWRVLNHFGPRLIPGARIVMQDYLHITSRQLAWLTSMIPGLTMTQTVETGTSVTFVASGPLPPLATLVPQDIQAISTAALMACGQRLYRMLPADRAAWLGTGLALDLLERSEFDAACAVLDEAVPGSGAHRQAVIDELLRLTRKAAPKVQGRLIEVVGYLRARILPAEVRAAAGATIVTHPDRPMPLQDMDRDQAMEISRALLAPRSPTALAARYVLGNGMPDELSFRRLFGALGASVELGTPATLEELGLAWAGASVVEIGPGPSMSGLALRCLGARRYTGVTGQDNLNLRTHRNHFTGAKLRIAFSLAELSEIMPDIAFVADQAQVEAGSADILLLHLPMTGAQDAIAAARRLLRSGGTLVISWQNPRSWSGHGRTPRTVAEVDPADAEQQAVVDWGHLGTVRRTVPKLAEVEEMLNSGFTGQRVIRGLDDPKVILRLSNRLFRSHPRLDPEDFVFRSLTIIAQRSAGS